MTNSNSENSISVIKKLNAPIERVFAHFTDPDLLALWHNPNQVHTPEISVDLQVGGAYRFEMKDMESKTHVAVGTYIEIIPNEKLVFSWQWEDGPHPETQVTVLFKTNDSGTEVELIHEGFTDQEVMGHHNQGWNGLLGNLEKELG
jgi:uncharacterized protein YndB with AHSA1/START domain